MRLLSFVLLLSAGAIGVATARQAPPDTEIFLASLSVDGDTVKVGRPVNITNSAGYDNQPSFTPDGRAILFTSARNAAASAEDPTRPPATDIYRFDIATTRVHRVTSTPEAEYSPIVTPDGRGISVVRVEADRTQRVWRFTMEGKDPELVLGGVKPVGYHAWIDERRLALFVLGEPATLQLADRTTGKVDVIARDIGRSLQPIPKGGVSYVQVVRAPGEGKVTSLTVMELDPSLRAPRALIPVVSGAAEADLAWTPDGMLLMAHAGTLHAWRYGRPSWIAGPDLDALGLSGVTRLAVSPSADRIAFVAQSKRD